jgi:hypothetical protein
VKLRFYPKHGIVTRLVNERVEALQKEVADAEAELTKYNEVKLSSVNFDADPFNVRKASLLSELRMAEMRHNSEKDLLLLLESHSAPEVLVEVEI